MNKAEVDAILRKEGFTINARTGDSTQIFYSRDDDHLSCEVDFTKQTFELSFNVGISINVKYLKLALVHLGSPAFELAMGRMERMIDSRVVKNLRQEWIDHSLAS